MINEAYCSYELSKLLNEDGFQGEASARYATEVITESWYDDYRERVLNFHWDEGYFLSPEDMRHDIYGETIPAPTHQTAIAYLWETHRILVEPFVSIDLNGKYHYGFRLIGSDCKDIVGHEDLVKIGLRNSYDEIVEVALVYVLKNIVTKKIIGKTLDTYYIFSYLCSVNLIKQQTT